MGADSYYYYTKYQSNLNAVLQDLRHQEFQAGRYNPVIQLPDFPVTESSPAPGAQHDSIEAALRASDADGTRSILDILRVANQPCPLSRDELEIAWLGGDNCEMIGEICNTAFPLSDVELHALFGTEQPGHEIVQSVILGDINSEASEAFWDSLDRGMAKYIIIYEGEQPSEVFFVGFSFD
jgi:hypothetical protein